MGRVFRTFHVQSREKRATLARGVALFWVKLAQGGGAITLARLGKTLC